MKIATMVGVCLLVWAAPAAAHDGNGQRYWQLAGALSQLSVNSFLTPTQAIPQGTGSRNIFVTNRKCKKAKTPWHCSLFDRNRWTDGTYYECRVFIFLGRFSFKTVPERSTCPADWLPHGTKR